MSRFMDTPELFGVGTGYSTCGDLYCHICGVTYNKGNDKTENYNGDSVGYTDFAGVCICEACFEQVENEIIRRMPSILKWYKAIIQAKQKSIDDIKAELKDL